MFTHIFRYRLKCLLRDKTTFLVMIFLSFGNIFNMSLVISIAEGLSGVIQVAKS